MSSSAVISVPAAMRMKRRVATVDPVRGLAARTMPVERLKAGKVKV